MKKLFVIFCVIILSVGCSNNPSSKSEEDQRLFFSRVDDVSVVVDRETSVQYIWFVAGGRGGLCALIDSTGMPILHTDEYHSSSASEKNHRFFPSNTDGVEVIVDRETCVQYIWFIAGGRGGFSALIDSHGKPILYKGEFPE